MSGVVQVANPIISIERKKCSKCGKVKNVSEFYKRPNVKDGLMSSCKKCNHIKCFKWIKKNPDKKRKIDKKSQMKNMTKKLESTRQWRINNPKKYKEQVKRQNAKRTSTAKGKLNHNIRIRICTSLCGSKDYRHWESLVGYTLNELKEHIEKKFKNGMNWENYGKKGWHIDHKIPITAFNFEKPEHIDFKKCWALSNLQPLWALDNIKKSNKLTNPHQPSLLL
jgi:hypothetical protein